MRILRLLPVLSVFAAFGVFSPSALAVTTDCDGLQDALDNSNAGDTVTLSDTSLCFGHYDLPSHQITLEGAGNAGDNGFDGDGGDQILSGTDVENTAIRNLLFTNGDTTGNGGAIALDGNSPATVENNIFTDNFAGTYGGAVSVEYIGATTLRAAPQVTLTGNQFGEEGDGNRTGFGGRGGAAYVISQNDADISDNNFVENGSPDGSGGGLYAIVSGNVNLAGNDFDGNVAAAKGGGATLRACSTGTIDQNSFEDNELTRPLLLSAPDVSTAEFSPGGGPMGGGLHIADDQRRCSIFEPVGLHKRAADSEFDIVQHDNEFRGNQIQNTFDSDFHGTGGGEGTQDVDVKSTDDTHVNNTIHTPDGEGGGLGSQNQGINTLEARNLVAAANSTITETVEVTAAQEQPDGEGGGVYWGESGNTVSLLDSTVVSNQSAFGSGVGGGCFDELHLHNSIVHGNTGANEQVGGFDSSICAFKQRDKQRAANPGTRDIRFTDLCDPGYAGNNGNICADPQLVDPANGNVRETGNSPTIDKGSNALVPGDLPNDWKGAARIQGASVDMGADEATPAAFPLPAPSGCLNGGGNVKGKTLGPARLGRSQTAQRAIFQGAKLRTRKGLDKYCAIPKGWFRIGYPNARLFKPYGKSLRKATKNRVVLILTSSPRFTLLGLTRGDKRAKVRQKLKKEFSFVVGANRWYVVRTTGKRILLVKLQDGLVREIGLGDGRFAKTNKLLKAYLRAWEGGL
jgi:hypothetical protein